MSKLVEVTNLYNQGCQSKEEKGKIELLSKQLDPLRPVKTNHDKLNHLLLEYPMKKIESEYLENFSYRQNQIIDSKESTQHYIFN